MTTGLNSTAQYQPDGLVVFPYEDIFIGIGNVFNPSQEAGPAAAIGQVNMVLAWSADGRHWKWLRPVDSFIPLGAAGDFDACGVFSAKQEPVRTMVNNTMRFYYAGCNGPFFGSRGCALGFATLQQDGFAGYQGGRVVTVPVAVLGDSLTISLDGGNSSGVRVGIVGDPERPAVDCNAITGKHTDVIVTWGKNGSDLKKLYGAVQIEFVIPDDATVFAFSFKKSHLPKPKGCRIGATATEGAEPPTTEFGGGDYTMAWDGNTETFFDYSKANGGYTTAKLDHEASISSIRFFPRSQYLERCIGGRFVGITAAGQQVPLARISEFPSLTWNLLNVTETVKITSVQYEAPDGASGNMAEIEVYVADCEVWV
jgi:hypothetical protein